MSFLKFEGVGEFNGQQLYWGRASIDGAPFAGQAPPMLRSDEAERMLEKTSDAFYGTFDTSDPEQQHAGHTLQMVLDRRAAGWYDIIRWNEQWGTRDGSPVLFVFVVWEAQLMRANFQGRQRGQSFLAMG